MQSWTTRLVGYLLASSPNVYATNDAAFDWETAIDGLRAVEDLFSKRRGQADDDPSVHRHVMTTIDPREYFARSAEPRVRSPEVTFRIGDVVRHTKWNYRAVIVGWDRFAKVPESWVQQNSWANYDASEDPGAKGSGNYWRIVPNYALLVDTRDRPGSTSTTYVPQTSLELLPGAKIVNKLLPAFFKGYMSDCGLYIATNTLATTYPDDSSDCKLDWDDKRVMESMSWVDDPVFADLRQSLRDKGADISSLEDGGSRPIHWAAQNGDVSLAVQALMENKEDLQARDARGMDAMALATKEGHVQMVNVLALNRAMLEPTGANQTLLGIAIAEGHMEIASWLLARRAEVHSPEPSGVQAVHHAAKRGHQRGLDFLLAKKAPVEASDSAGIQPLHIAVEKGYQGIAEFLISKRADFNAVESSGIRAIHWAAARGYIDILRILLNANADVSPTESVLNSQPLFWASEYGHAEAVTLLVAARANIDAMSQYGSSLDIASQRGHSVVVHTLLKLRASPVAARDQHSTGSEL